MKDKYVMQKVFSWVAYIGGLVATCVSIWKETWIWAGIMFAITVINAWALGYWKMQTKKDNQEQAQDGTENVIPTTD